MSSKVCSRCKISKDLDSFHNSKKARDGKQHRCKDCVKTSEASKTWRMENPEAFKRSGHKTKLKLKYGLSLEDIHKLFEQQNGLCRICESPIDFNAKDKRNKPHIDHNHETGEVRGLLCLTCNTGIGMFGDSVDLLQKAILYLSGSVRD